MAAYNASCNNQPPCFGSITTEREHDLRTYLTESHWYSPVQTTRQTLGHMEGVAWYPKKRYPHISEVKWMIRRCWVDWMRLVLSEQELLYSGKLLLHTDPSAFGVWVYAVTHWSHSLWCVCAALCLAYKLQLHTGPSAFGVCECCSGLGL